NEPPIVYYRYPIIGHTFEFITNCGKLFAESREKHGDIFSLYVFGELVTVAGNDLVHEVYKNEGLEFNFLESHEQVVTRYVFSYAAFDFNKSLKLLREFFKLKLANNTRNIHQGIIESMNFCVGECVVVERRLLYKKKLGDRWDAPVDALQTFLDNPEIAPDFDPNHVNYNIIVDIIGVYIFASMANTSIAPTYALVELAKRKKDYWQELHQEAQEVNKQSNGKPTYNDFKNMVKLENFIKESLRINSNVSNVPRPCVNETYTFTNGYQIPQGNLL
ncbi:11230_t:CDS:2, partial [Dentiscutata heterogama]